jgi:hypothetical protein
VGHYLNELPHTLSELVFGIWGELIFQPKYFVIVNKCLRMNELPKIIIILSWYRLQLTSVIKVNQTLGLRAIKGLQAPNEI